MNKLSIETINKINDAKEEARQTGYFWMIVVQFHIVGTLMFSPGFLSEDKYNLFVNIFIIIIELIFIYLSFFKFSRLISVISPIIILSMLVVSYFSIKLPIDFYLSSYLNLIEKNVGKVTMFFFIVLPFLPIMFFYRGIKGSFKYHELMKESN